MEVIQANNQYQNSNNTNNNIFQPQQTNQNLNEESNINQSQYNEDSQLMKKSINIKKENHRVEIRKKNTLNILNKKRTAILHKFRNSDLKDNLKEEESLTLEAAIENYYQAHSQQDSDSLKVALHTIRFILIEYNETEKIEEGIDKICQSDILNHICSYISPQFEEDTKLQIECLCILSQLLITETNENMNKIIKNDVVSKFLYHFGSKQVEIREFSVQCVSNIVGDNKDFKIQLINNGLINQITDVLIQQEQSQGILDNLSFLLNNIMAADDVQLDYDKLEPLIPLISTLINQDLQDSVNESLTFDVFCALASLMENRKSKIISKFLSRHNGIVLKTIQFLKKIRHKPFDKAMLIQALHFLLNISVTQDDESLMQVMLFGLHDVLYDYCTYPNKEIKRLSVYIIGNLCQMDSDYIQLLFDHHRIIIEIFRAIDEEDFSVKKQAYTALSNLFSNSSREQTTELIKLNGIEKLVSGLDYNDKDLLLSLLQGIYDLLTLGEEVQDSIGLCNNPYLMSFDNEFNGIQKLDKIANTHYNKEVVELVEEILSGFYIINPDLSNNNYEQNQQSNLIKGIRATYTHKQVNSNKDSEFWSQDFEKYTEVEGKTIQDDQQLLEKLSKYGLDEIFEEFINNIQEDQQSDKYRVFQQSNDEDTQWYYCIDQRQLFYIASIQRSYPEIYAKKLLLEVQEELKQMPGYEKQQIDDIKKFANIFMQHLLLKFNDLEKLTLEDKDLNYSDFIVQFGTADTMSRRTNNAYSGKNNKKGQNDNKICSQNSTCRAHLSTTSMLTSNKSNLYKLPSDHQIILNSSSSHVQNTPQRLKSNYNEQNFSKQNSYEKQQNQYSNNPQQLQNQGSFPFYDITQQEKQHLQFHQTEQVQYTDDNFQIQINQNNQAHNQQFLQQQPYQMQHMPMIQYQTIQNQQFSNNNNIQIDNNRLLLNQHQQPIMNQELIDEENGTQRQQDALQKMQQEQKMQLQRQLHYRNMKIRVVLLIILAFIVIGVAAPFLNDIL